MLRCPERTAESWHEEALRSTWTSPQAVKAHDRNASICGNNRVVFNISGNKYRLVVEIQHRAGIAWVKCIGSGRAALYTGRVRGSKQFAR